MGVRDGVVATRGADGEWKGSEFPEDEEWMGTKRIGPSLVVGCGGQPAGMPPGWCRWEWGLLAGRHPRARSQGPRAKQSDSERVRGGVRRERGGTDNVTWGRSDRARRAGAGLPMEHLYECIMLRRRLASSPEELVDVEPGPRSCRRRWCVGAG